MRKAVRSRGARSLGAALACMVASVATMAATDATAQETVVPPPSGFRPRLVRQGTVSLGGNGQYGLLPSKSGLGERFDRGFGLGARVRYRTETQAALGLSFEGQRFDARDEPVLDTDPKHLQVIVTTLDYYRFFRTRTRTPAYWVAGAGLAQTRRVDKDDERQFPGDGGVFTLGLGSEYWINRTLTADLFVRYYGVLLSSRLNHDVQVGVGFNFYTSP